MCVIADGPSAISVRGKQVEVVERTDRPKIAVTCTVQLVVSFYFFFRVLKTRRLAQPPASNSFQFHRPRATSNIIILLEIFLLTHLHTQMASGRKNEKKMNLFD